MRIFFERTGGFAGRKLQARVDTSALPEAEAGRLHRLVTDSRFFDLPARLEASGPQADRFRYVVTVQAESRSHTVQASEAAVPARMRPLLDWLTRQGRP